MQRNLVQSYDQLYNLLHSICQLIKLDEIHSQDLCKSVLEAEISGNKSHGLTLFYFYIKQIMDGIIPKSGFITILKETSNSFFIDGSKLIGAYVLSETIRLSLVKALDTPIIAFSIRNCGHIGSLKYYLGMFEEKKLIPLLFVCSHHKLLAPAHSKGPVLGPNPLGAYFSTSQVPFIMDFASSISCAAKALSLSQQNQKFPGQWCVDQEGCLSDDPKSLFTHNNTYLLPVGGEDHGYKGFSISLILELLARGLNGDVEQGIANSIFGIVINPHFFAGWDEYISVADSIQSDLRDNDVRFPGMVSFQQKQSQLQSGLTINRITLNLLLNLKKKIQSSELQV